MAGQAKIALGRTILINGLILMVSFTLFLGEWVGCWLWSNRGIFTTAWNADTSVELYLHPTAPTSAITALLEELPRHPLVADIQHVDPVAGGKMLQEHLPDRSWLTELGAELPHVIIIHPQVKYCPSVKLTAWLAELKANPVIAEIGVNEAKIERSYLLSNWGERWLRGWLIIGTLGLLSWELILGYLMRRQLDTSVRQHQPIASRGGWYNVMGGVFALVALRWVAMLLSDQGINLVSIAAFPVIGLGGSAALMNQLGVKLAQRIDKVDGREVASPAKQSRKASRLVKH